ncbi:putative fad binding domain protein [Botrytis cinerea BcDW1]|uniref:Putative fad binding domain protein n=1 Tax=Botryotinia fuckeliana (strain BcDW1) TaxID=1290391 RepID=M7TPU3_BOTF1|nr:putative fad binding domain protein [Botrytis cinerea BcDW1]
MAKPAQHYKVIIAEGGIAGVTLTLIFEKLGISYFLLESRDTLESNRGAKCVRTSARVASIEESDDYVTVTTIDGLSLTADIVVGADGVRSTVRIQIDSNIPEALTADDLLPAPQSMACQRPPKASPRVSALPFTERTKQSSASQVPRYTEAEAEALCQSVAYIQVTPKLKFGGIYKNRVVAVKTGGEEGVAKGWHTDRAIIVGDAACKALSAGG